MKKKVLIICLLLISIFVFSGCNKRKIFNEMNGKFVNALSTEVGAKAFQIQSLEATRYEDKYYYYVGYFPAKEEDGVETVVYDDYHWYLYTFDESGKLEKIEEASVILNDKLLSDNNFKEYYTAKANGDNIDFSKTEIEKMVNDYYED